MPATVPDLPLAVIDAVNTATPVTSHIHTDHLGRPVRMTSATKATVWSATWKPWGEAQTLSGTSTNNLRFPGQYFQIETGLAYNHHRHYDPVTGRYTQADPLRFVDGPSVYAYAGSSPFMKTDRSGQSSVEVVLPVAGGLALIDGPIPVGDVAAVCLLAGARLYDYMNSKPPKQKDVPDTGPPNTWVDGQRRSRYYGPDGRPQLDLDKPHQGNQEPHAHDWDNGRREDPGRPYSPIPK